MVFGIQILEPSGWGIVALTALAILRGLLVTRRALEDERGNWREQLERERAISEMWRSAYEYEREARGQEAEHGSLSIETARTATAALRAVAEGGADAQTVA